MKTLEDTCTQKARPVTFFDEMVRAILDGRKTQTRILVLPKPPADTTKMYAEENPDFTATTGRWYAEYLNDGRKWTDGPLYRCRYGVPGDLLWVREAWRVGAWNENGQFALDYRADGYCRREWLTPTNDPDGAKGERLRIQSVEDCQKAGVEPDTAGCYRWEPGSSPCRWRPARFMPRWAARITLKVGFVRGERVQDISDGDAEAEGVEIIPHSDLHAVEVFSSLWQECNGSRGSGWERNDFVFVLGFALHSVAGARCLGTGMTEREG